MKPKKEQIDKELYIMLLCCKSSLNQTEVKTLHSIWQNPNFDMQHFISLMHQHAVIPLVYTKLKELNPTPALLQKLKPLYYHIIKQNMALYLHLLQTYKILQEEQIKVLSLKGPLLAHLLYGDITKRQYGDIDILILHQDRYKAHQCLRKHHYQSEIDLHSSTIKPFFQSVNVLGYVQNDMLVEVHWELLSKNYAVAWEEAELWQHNLQITIDDKRLPTLEHINHFLYLCVHGSKHLYERASWVCDIDRYLHSNYITSWHEVLQIATQKGILRMVLLSLLLTHRLLQTPLPAVLQNAIHQDPKVTRLAKYILRQHYQSQEISSKNIRSFVVLVQMRERLRDKVRFVVYALFYPKLQDFKWVQLPYGVHLFYPLLRPLRLLLKYLGYYL